MIKPHILTLFLGLFSILLYSCSNQKNDEKEINPDHLINISEFKVDTIALHDNEGIEVLCASDRVFPTDDINYFVQAVVVSLETGDTVNVLVAGTINITESNRLSRFVSSNNDIAKVLQNLNNIEDGTNVKDLEPPKFDKVYRNPEYISLKTSHFPSIIGMITELQTPNI